MRAGTSISGPTTAASASPEPMPKVATATAIASSKLLPAAVNDREAVASYVNPSRRDSQNASPNMMAKYTRSGSAIRSTSNGSSRMRCPCIANISTMVYNSPSSAVGPNFGMKVSSYQSLPFRATSSLRVRKPATSGTPRKIPTLRAISLMETWSVVVSAPNHCGTTVRKSQPSTEYVRIWNTELSATSTAASSPEPQASEFQISTMAMQRARPMSTRPFRYAGMSGRNSHARASITRGPRIQFRNSDVPSSFVSRTWAPMVS